MALDTALKELGLDRYDRNARLRPALLTVLPLFILIVLWYPAVSTAYGAIASLLVGCGVTFLLAQLARQRGRALEMRWSPAVGKAHSATLLLHGDRQLPAASKARYRASLEARGLTLATAEEEQLDPHEALQTNISAIEWLLEATRPQAETSLLLDENIAYGFRRNLRGLKPLALLILTATSLANAFLTWRAWPTSPQMEIGAALGLAYAAAIAGWIFGISKPFVVDASLAFARRLLAQCDAGAH